MIILALALTLGIAFVVYSTEAASSRVVVRSHDRTWIFSLDTEETFSVSGPIGETVVSINKGEAGIVSSPCSGQTCVAAGALHRNGQWTACLPNRIFLLVEGAIEPDIVDAVSW